MNKSLLAVAVASLCSYTSFSYAQEATADETVVVTANRFAQSEQSTLANVDVITREDFERTQAKSITDVLRKLTGIQITQNGGRGQKASIFVRGTSSDQVLVLVDGIRFARAAKGAVDFSQVPLSYVDRIEYIRGARASLYGSEAIGGVINIITIARSTEAKTKLSGGLGSLDYKELSVASGFSTSENGQLNVALGNQQDKGYNVKPIEGVNDGDRHGFDSTNGLVGYTHKLNEHISFFGDVRAYENVYQYDSSYSGTRGYYEAEKDDRSLTVGGQFNSEKWAAELQLTTQKQKAWNYKQSAGKYSGTADEVEQDNVQLVNHYQLSNSFSLAGGIDWRDEAYVDKSTDKKYSRGNSAIFGVLSADLDTALLEASARLDDNEEFGSQSTYNLAAGYQFAEEFGIKASYGTSFKAPNLYQQYAPTYGSLDLEPEESKSAELTLSGLVQGVFWSLTGYDYKIENIIDYNSSTFQYSNVDGESHIQGVELTAEFDTGIIQHQVSADYKDAEDASGSQLQRRAKEMYKWNALVSFNKVDWSISYLYVGKRPDYSYVTYSDVDLDAYSLFDTALSYYANESTTVSARVDNLFDKEYETASAYPAAERSYYLNIAYQF